MRSIILMQVDGDRSPMVAQMRADFESQAQAERLAVSDLQAQADAPIRLPPIELITERVLSLKALTESLDIDGARSTLRRYLKDGQITLTPEPFGDAQAYTARAEFLPLVMLTDKAETPSQIALGGSCPRLVARGRFVRCTTRFLAGSRPDRCMKSSRWCDRLRQCPAKRLAAAPPCRGSSARRRPRCRA